MDAVVTVGVWNANGIMVRALVWAWMLWSSHALGTQTELWFGHQCCGHRGRLERERNYGLSIGLGMDALVIACSRTTNGIMVWASMLWSPWAFGKRTGLWFEHWFGNGCSSHGGLLQNERNCGLGMDALVIVCSRNTNGIMVWAWMLWSPYALGARKESWLGHGCFSHRNAGSGSIS